MTEHGMGKIQPKPAGWSQPVGSGPVAQADGARGGPNWGKLLEEND